MPSSPSTPITGKMLASSDGRWLFSAPPAPGVVDDRLRASRLWAQLKRATTAAGVKQGTLHSFRHFFVSRMANANVSPFKVMKIVGHSSLDIILTYCHIDEEELLGAVDGVNFDVTVGENDEEGNKKWSSYSQPPPGGRRPYFHNLLFQGELRSVRSAECIFLFRGWGVKIGLSRR